jgi:hypothetical protein
MLSVSSLSGKGFFCFKSFQALPKADVFLLSGNEAVDFVGNASCGNNAEANFRYSSERLIFITPT